MVYETYDGKIESRFFLFIQMSMNVLYPVHYVSVCINSRLVKLVATTFPAVMNVNALRDTSLSRINYVLVSYYFFPQFSDIFWLAFTSKDFTLKKGQKTKLTGCVIKLTILHFERKKCKYLFLYMCVCQSINQLIDRSIDQSIDRSIYWSVNQSIIQSINQKTNQPPNQPTNHPTNQPINQPNNQSINQSIGLFIFASVHSYISISISKSLFIYNYSQFFPFW